MLTLAAVTKNTTQALLDYSNTPRLDAECLIALAIQQPRHYLYAYSEVKPDQKALQAIDCFIKRRQQGEPIAYIVGKKEFWSLMLTVTPDTLIPRPETEHLVEWTLANFANDKPLKVADLGTGSGAIAIALASERPNWRIHATDFNTNSLAIAQHNATAHQVQNITFFQGDWCHALTDNDYDIIISNPPYISQDDPHLPSLQHEPLRALQSQQQGLDDLTKISRQAQQKLVQAGTIILEHGYNQATAVNTLLQPNYQNIELHCDLNQLARFTTATLTQPPRGTE